MSAAFVDPLHTTKEKEGTSIINGWKLKEKKEESHEPINICSIDFKMADDDDIVEHFEMLNNRTKTIMEWTTIETGKKHGPGHTPLKMKRGNFNNNNLYLKSNIQCT